ncbi:MAG TPA: transketolase, partial [Polyangia bacterium]|nr:transketolase [Polyangia bacterium]
VVFRPYEQIRTDVCLHQLPVKVVGNGGGYGYGIMGATHHALEDVAAMRALPNLRVYLPLTATDVAPVIERMAADPLANYLRLNTPASLPHPIAPFAPWRRLKSGKRCVVVGMGPVLGNLYQLGDPDLVQDLEIWSVGTLPLEELPVELLASLKEKQRLVIIEEHSLAGGLAEAISYALMRQGVCPRSFTSLHATGYPSGRYGSQRWHQEETGLSGQALRARLETILLG